MRNSNKVENRLAEARQRAILALAGVVGSGGDNE